MRSLKKKPEDKPAIPIAPLIDAVFLLLIYFMVTSSLEKQEADISFELPGTVEQEEPVELPDEQVIEIREDGQIVVNEYNYDRPGATISPSATLCLVPRCSASTSSGDLQHRHTCRDGVAGRGSGVRKRRPRRGVGRHLTCERH